MDVWQNGFIISINDTVYLHRVAILFSHDARTGQQGIKVHKSADPALIAAVLRLHAKGLVTQSDGGYLTSLGRDAAAHAQALRDLLTTGVAASV